MEQHAQNAFPDTPLLRRTQAPAAQYALTYTALPVSELNDADNVPVPTLQMPQVFVLLIAIIFKLQTVSSAPQTHNAQFANQDTLSSMMEVCAKLIALLLTANTVLIVLELAQPV